MIFNKTACSDLSITGWLNRDIVDDFAAYARVCFEELGPDVSDPFLQVLC